MAKKNRREHREGTENDDSTSQPKRRIGLDWESISKTRQDFVDANCILCMLCPQLGGDELDNEDVEQGQMNEVTEDDSDMDDEATELCESDTRDQHDKQKLMVEASLKSRFLDRLAEVLARVKKRPEAAKQVASAYMAEIDNEDGSQRVEVRLAKNEGLSGEDEAYLKELFGVLMQIAPGETSPEEAERTLLKQTILYARPRIDFYVESLRHEFTRKPRVQPSDPSKIQKFVAAFPNLSDSLKSWRDEAWRDYDFDVSTSVTNEQISASEEKDNISCEAREETDEGQMRDTASLFQRVLDFCKATNPPDEDLAEIIKSTFVLQKDVKSRAIFQGCFVGHFGLALEAALRAQRALLFLCRLYAAVQVFLRAAAWLPSFRNMSFKTVKPDRGVWPLKSMKQKTLRDALAGLSIPSTQVSMAKFYKTNRQTIAEVDKEFDEARRQHCTVHAEIQLVDDFEKRREEPNWRVHPYIGGSKLCCFLCDSFLRNHGFFQYRGSHWKITHMWQIPDTFETKKTANVFDHSIRLVYGEVVEHVRAFVSGEVQPKKDPLRPESIVDLSTAATISSRDMAEMTLSSPSTRWMGKGAFGHTAADDAILLVPDFQDPGHTTVVHEGRFIKMLIEDAEKYKDRFERLKLLPEISHAVRRQCHQPACQSIPFYRCKACRTSYCSRRCQKLDWNRHLFICTVRGRPTLADSLVLLIRDAIDFEVPINRDLLRRRLLADKDISTAFGFRGCETSEEFDSLLILYRHLTSRHRSAVLLQTWINNCELEDKIKTSILARQEPRLPCHEWFLRSTTLFLKRDPRIAAHVEYGLRRAQGLRLLDGPGDEEVSDARYRIVSLYSHLLKDFDNIPDRSNPAWLDFGFCLCQNREWMVRMAGAYVELAVKASLSEIINHWEIYNRLDGLFEAKCIDITMFNTAGISFGRPAKMELGVYQLMVEINHVHRGIWCQCGTVHENSCKKFPESRFSIETVGEYGFLNLSPWERWQMIFLWEEVFTSKNFNAREMLAARRSEDGMALQNYVERMVDTRKYFNNYKTGLLFPDLRGRLNWERSSIPFCFCICH